MLSALVSSTRTSKHNQAARLPEARGSERALRERKDHRERKRRSGDEGVDGEQRKYARRYETGTQINGEVEADDSISRYLNAKFTYSACFDDIKYEH